MIMQPPVKARILLSALEQRPKQRCKYRETVGVRTRCVKAWVVTILDKTKVYRRLSRDLGSEPFGTRSSPSSEMQSGEYWPICQGGLPPPPSGLENLKYRLFERRFIHVNSFTKCKCLRIKLTYFQIAEEFVENSRKFCTVKHIEATGIGHSIS
jgi:hypothetical protein